MQAIQPYLNSFHDQQHSDIFRYFIRRFANRKEGYWVDLLHDHFINGYPYQPGQGERPNDPAKDPLRPGEDPSGFSGFFEKVFGKTLLTTRWSGSSYTEASSRIKQELMAGNMVMPIYRTGGVFSHVVTLWGAEYDLDGNLCGVFLSDSDDHDIADRYRAMLRYTANNDDGAIRITTGNDPKKGSFIVSLNTLSLGQQYWKQYFGEAEKPLTLTWSDTSFPYDGQEHAPKAVLSGPVEGEVRVVVTGARRDAGTHSATARLEGADAGKYTLTNGTQPFTITPAQTELILTANKTADKTYVLHAAVSGAVYGETLAGTVNFSNGKDLNQTVEINGGLAELSWTAPVSEKYTITATFTPANQNYTGSTDSVDVDLNKKEQTTPLHFDPIEGKVFGNDPFTLTAAGGDGAGTFEYASSNHNVITIEGATATIVGAGDTEITATKLGDDQYNSKSVTIQVSVAKAAAPQINYPTAGGLTYGQILADSSLNGGSRDLGDFAWADPDGIPGGGTTNHVVTFTPNALTEQNYAITERSREVAVTVTPSTPTAVLNASVDNSGDAPAITLTVHVDKVGHGAAANDGTVTFLYEQDGGYVQLPGADPVTVRNGMAQFVWKDAVPGKYSFKAQFSGNTNYTKADTSVASIDTTKPPMTVHPITVHVVGSGTASAEPASAAQGTVVKLTATPADGSIFKGWSVLSGNVTLSNDSFTMPDAPVTLQAVFEKKEEPGGGGDIGGGDIGGGGTGGGGIGGGGAQPENPGTVHNPDGSTTEKVEGPDGTVIETTKKPDGSSVVETTKKDGTTSETQTSAAGETQVQVKIPERVSAKAEQDGVPVVLPMPPVSAQSGGKAPVISVDLDGASHVTVSVPVEKAGPGTVAVVVHPDGTKQVVRKSVVTESGVVMTLDGSTTFEVEDRSKSFEDVQGHWASDAISFVSSHELYSGTSATTFSPDAGVTRGMVVKILHNLESNPEVEQKGLFSDVGPDAWFADSVQWAVDSGIVTGVGSGQFAPDRQITREDIAVMLHRYAGSPAPDGEALDFHDADQVSTYADAAIRWAVEKGIMTGKDALTLDPRGTATRAQTAVMMMRFMNLMVG